MARVDPDPTLQMPAAIWAAIRRQLLKKQKEGWRASTPSDGPPVVQTEGPECSAGKNQLTGW